MYNTLPLHLAPPHITTATTFYIASFHIESNAISGIIPNHTTFHFTPFLTISHISYRTSTSRGTLFHFAIPYFKSHHIGHIMRCTPFHITDVPHSMYSTPHQCQITPYGHIIYASHHHISHHILHMAPHFTCSPSCIIPPHLTVITPSSTSHYYVTHNIPHHGSVRHHFLHPTTYHISHNTTSTTRYRTVSRHTLYLIPHRTTFHIPCHSTHSTSFHIAQRSTFRATARTPIHITPQLSITPF